MKSTRRLPRWRLPLWGTLLAAVLLSGGITLLALWCQPNALRTVLSHLLDQPLLIVLNAMPIGLLVLLFTALFRNVFYSAALVNLITCVLSIANRVKLEVRDEPVFPRDLALLKEVGSVVSSYDIRYPVGVIVTVLLITLLLAAIGVFVGTRPFPIQKLRGWVGSLVGAAASFGVLAGLIVTVYASIPLYNSFHVSNAYYIPSVFNELGFPYCFCHQFTTYPIDKPAGFNRAQAEDWDSQTPAQEGQGKPVHLIMIMNEAFADVSDGEMFAYTAENDPLSTIHRLRQDPHAISGHLVVPGFAGGTANTEFDVMTGMQTNAISAMTTSSFRVVNRNLDSLFRVFGADGYHTSYVHPGDNWFYNRENVLRWMGAEETVFVEQMQNPEMKGRWVTDDYMADRIEQMFETAVDQGQLLCNYTTTIQNHMSYTADKYGPDYVYPEVPLTVEVSPESETLLKVYLEGARDADAMLGRLVDYFSQREEPVVLAFWGDHLPYLGDNMLAYRELGTEIALPDEEKTNPFCAYETPFVVWANDAAADTLEWENTVAELGLSENGQISASFLGAMLLDLTGRGQESPWFAFLNQLRRECPVVQKNTYLLSDGSYVRSQEPDQPELRDSIDQWRKWSYYKLRYKEIH